jgi:hypothetical protein
MSANLVASHRLLYTEVLVVGFAVEHLLGPGQALLVEQVEVQRLALCTDIHFHRYGHQAKTDDTLPEGFWYRSPPEVITPLEIRLPHKSADEHE